MHMGTARTYTCDGRPRRVTEGVTTWRCGARRPWRFCHRRVVCRHTLRHRHLLAHRLISLPQDKDITDAKMQVQGQLAAQYIQDVMQVWVAWPDVRARL